MPVASELGGGELELEMELELELEMELKAKAMAMAVAVARGERSIRCHNKWPQQNRLLIYWPSFIP